MLNITEEVVPGRGSVGAWPGSPDHTAGRTAGKAKPPEEDLLLRRQLRSRGRLGRRDAPAGVPPLDMKQQSKSCPFHSRHKTHIGTFKLANETILIV